MGRWALVLLLCISSLASFSAETTDPRLQAIYDRVGREVAGEWFECFGGTARRLAVGLGTPAAFMYMAFEACSRERQAIVVKYREVGGVDLNEFLRSLDVMTLEFAMAGIEEVRSRR
jgi:hypothetical protein